MYSSFGCDCNVVVIHCIIIPAKTQDEAAVKQSSTALKREGEVVFKVILYLLYSLSGYQTQVMQLK